MFEPLRRELLDEMTPPELAEYEQHLLAALAEAEADDVRPVDWREMARPEQLPPDDDWRVIYARGGRGGGKTFMGSNVLAEQIQTNPPGEWAVIAPTYGDARDTCIESADSGLLTALGLPRSYAGWNRSMGELRLPSGSVVYADGADDGALRIQGKNLRGAWCDEIGLWKRWQVAWTESVRFAVRKAPGRIIATGTPKRGMPAIKLVKQLLADPRVVHRLLRTEDNAANLHPAALEELLTLRGTPLGQQELEGAVLDDDGAGLFFEDDWRFWRGDREALTVIDGPRRETYRLIDCTRFITIDLAASMRTSADFTVAAAWAITGAGDLLLLGRRRAHVPETDHAAFLEPLRTEWLQPNDTVHVESRMFGTTLVYELGRANVPLAELKADTDKVTRAVPYARLVRQHKVFLPEGAMWLGDWISEHTDFNVDLTAHDDQVDVGAYAARVRVAEWIQPETATQTELRVAAERHRLDDLDFMTAAM